METRWLTPISPELEADVSAHQTFSGCRAHQVQIYVHLPFIVVSLLWRA